MTDSSPPPETVLVLEGEMTIYHAIDQMQRIRDHLAVQHDLWLDLSGVTEIDSAGLQLLFVAHNEAKAHGGTFILGALSQAVDDVLRLLRIKTQLGLTVTEEPAS